MSEVFSFRLDANNSREAIAIEVIHAWQDKGFSLRHIIVEALGKLDHGEGMTFGEQIDQVNEKLGNLLELIRSTGDSHSIEPSAIKAMEPSKDLSAHFLTSIKVASKPGIHIE